MPFFADSYALIDFVKGNKKYVKYFSEHDIVTTKLNLLELYYSALLRGSEPQAEEYFDSFLVKTLEIEDEDLKQGAKFKFENKKKKFSYVDAIGYAMAKARKLRFLTGDQAFKGMENVEYVK